VKKGYRKLASIVKVDGGTAPWHASVTVSIVPNIRLDGTHEEFTCQAMEELAGRTAADLARIAQQVIQP